MKKQSLLLGAAMAGLIVGSNVALAKSTKKTTKAKAQEAKVVEGECHGINSCKGTADCGGEGHSCKGENECKGHGWLKMTEAACHDKGGEFKQG